MKTDLMKYLKAELAKGVDPDELYVMLEQAEDEYKAEKEAKAKAEKAKQVQKELKERAAKDVFDTYVKYFNAVYPTNALPRDAKQLFDAELKFIDYMMTGEADEKIKDAAKFNDFLESLIKDLTLC